MATESTSGSTAGSTAGSARGSSPGSADEPVDHFPKGTGRPASGAFFAAGYRSLEALAGASESELAQLHGVGPKALRIVKAALEELGLRLEP